MFQHASALWPWLNAFAYCLSPLSMNHSTKHFLKKRRGSFAILELVAVVAAKKKVRIFKRRHHMTRLDNRHDICQKKITPPAVTNLNSGQGHFSLFRFSMIRLHLSVSNSCMSGQNICCANYCSKSPFHKNLFNFVDLFFGQATPRHVSVRRGRQALAAVARFDLLLLILFGLRVDLSF